MFAFATRLPPPELGLGLAPTGPGPATAPRVGSAAFVYRIRFVLLALLGQRAAQNGRALSRQDFLEVLVIIIFEGRLETIEARHQRVEPSIDSTII